MNIPVADIESDPAKDGHSGWRGVTVHSISNRENMVPMSKMTLDWFKYVAGEKIAIDYDENLIRCSQISPMSKKN